MNLEWAESLLEQWQEAGVPFLFKQWGTWALLNQMGAVGMKRRPSNSGVKMARQYKWSPSARRPEVVC